jgi:CubicO group peptidase (beta-lactamase class C family)
MLSTAAFVNPHLAGAGLATSFATIASTEPASLPQSTTALGVEIIGAGTTMDLDTFLTRTHTTSMVVVCQGEIVHEYYADGVFEHDLLLGASMSKSALATTVGMAVTSGRLELDQRLTDLVPGLAGTGYQGSTVRDVLTMTSGVQWFEEYRDPNGDGQRLLASIGAGAGVRAFLRTLPADRDAAARWRYCTPDSLALDWAREMATGDDLVAALTELWRALGCESDAIIGLDREASAGGVPLAGMAIAASARDWARIGMLQVDGTWAGTQLLDPAWVERSSQPAYDFTAPGRLPSEITTHAGFGYHWWPVDETGAAVMADGSRGQFTLVDRVRRTVVVKTSEWPYDDWLLDRQLRDLSYLALPAIVRAVTG